LAGNFSVSASVLKSGNIEWPRRTAMSNLVSVAGWRRERSLRAGGKERCADAAADLAASMRGEIDSHERQRRIRGWIAEGATFLPAFAERS
jgi:hypothetical protein